METIKEKKSLKQFTISVKEFEYLTALNQYVLNSRKRIDEIYGKMNSFLDYLIDKYENG